MSRRALYRVLVPAVALVAIAVAVGPATGQSDRGPRRATLPVVGGTSFEPNRFIRDSQRFGRDVTVIRSGGTVRIRNRTREPHTLSLVRRSQLPRRLRQLENCRVCEELFQAHGATEEDRPPSNPVVNVGAAGFDRPGDSIAFGPRESVSIRITAPRGTRLYFLCAPHPWMQGRFAVR
jgi:hypothetical protein